MYLVWTREWEVYCSNPYICKIQRQRFLSWCEILPTKTEKRRYVRLLLGIWTLQSIIYNILFWNDMNCRCSTFLPMRYNCTTLEAWHLKAQKCFILKKKKKKRIFLNKWSHCTRTFIMPRGGGGVVILFRRLRFMSVRLLVKYAQRWQRNGRIEAWLTFS